MPNRMPPARGYFARPLALLDQAGIHSSLRDFLLDLSKRDMVMAYDCDFADVGDLSNFTTAQAQTSTTFTQATPVLGGVIAGTTANTATASISAIGKLPVAGNYNVLFEARLKINTIATQCFEVGLVDAAGVTGASVITDIDVPTITATNAALFHMDTAQTHANLALATIGSFTSQTVATTLLTTANSPITAPTADTYMTFSIALLTKATSVTKASFWINGRFIKSHEVAAGAVNGAVSLYPWVWVGKASRVMSIDYIHCWHDRAALEAALE